jgi:ABC-type branched-subunit amino acid transport system ATPase component
VLGPSALPLSAVQRHRGWVSEPAIETQGLTKAYGRGRGIFDLNLSVEAGEVFGFIGPNGAGKTLISEVPTARRWRVAT